MNVKIGPFKVLYRQRIPFDRTRTWHHDRGSPDDSGDTLAEDAPEEARRCCRCVPAGHTFKRRWRPMVKQQFHRADFISNKLVPRPINRLRWRHQPSGIYIHDLAPLCFIFAQNMRCVSYKRLIIRIKSRLLAFHPLNLVHLAGAIFSRFLQSNSSWYVLYDFLEDNHRLNVIIDKSYRKFYCCNALLLKYVARMEYY